MGVCRYGCLGLEEVVASANVGDTFCSYGCPIMTDFKTTKAITIGDYFC